MSRVKLGCRGCPTPKVKGRRNFGLLDGADEHGEPDEHDDRDILFPCCTGGFRVLLLALVSEIGIEMPSR